MSTIKTQARATRHWPAIFTAALLLPLAAGTAQASSHREAPFIASQPKVDGTDFYMFKSYEPGRGDYVTLIANYEPLQDAYGGPNYFSLDPRALYEIHIDQNGDGKEDLTFQFRFTNTNRNNTFTINNTAVPIPLVINGGPISKPADSGLNVVETYTLTLIKGDRRKGTRSVITNGAPVSGYDSKTFLKPADNIGNKSIPDYAGYAAQHIFPINIPGCAAPGKVFVGQRKDPFVVNLGETFDLINIKSPAVGVTSATAESDAKDSLADKNVTSLALEVPTACLTNGSEPVIGGWTTASIRQGRLVNPLPKDSGDVTREGGAWTQVSRLGMPLVNEVVIGLKDKDKFNTSKPVNDAGSNAFGPYVFTPTLPVLIQTLYGPTSAAMLPVTAPSNYPRNDLVAAFLTGIKGLNQPAQVVPAEMLRLNTAIAPTPKGQQSRLGPLTHGTGQLPADLAGFPNGRRPGDDVVDIELRVAMGRLCSDTVLNTLINDPQCTPAAAPAGQFDFTDGALLNDSMTDGVFPYLKKPLPGSPQTGAQ